MTDHESSPEYPIEQTADIENVEHFETPADPIDDFLESNAEIMAAGEEFWRAVRHDQLEVEKQYGRLAEFSMALTVPAEKENFAAGRAGAKSPSLSEARRFLSRHAKKTAALVIQNQAQHTLKYFVEFVIDNRSNASEVSIDELVAQFEESLDLNLNFSVADEVANQPNIRLNVEHAQYATDNLLPAVRSLSVNYLRAYCIQLGAAGARIEKYAGRSPEAARAFVAKSYELALLAEHGYVPYPGFLENIAVLLGNKRAGFRLREKIEAAAPSENDLALGTLEQLFEAGSDSNLRKEVGSFIAGMRLVAGTAESAFGLSRSQLIGMLAARPEIWPANLKELVRHNAKHQAQAISREFLDFMVGRYYLPGRMSGLHTINRSSSMIAPNVPSLTTKRKSSRRNAKGGKAGSSHTARQPASIESIYEVVPDRPEADPINHFGSISPGKDGSCHYDTVNGIDELLATDVFDSYLSQFDKDGEVSQAARLAVTHITEHPIERDSDTYISQKAIRLDNADVSFADLPRLMRVVNLGDIPGVVPNEQVSRSWLAYNLIIHRGQPALVFAGLYEFDEDESENGFA